MSFNKSIPKLTLVSSGFTGTTNSAFFTTEYLLAQIRTDGFGTQLSNGIANINLPSLQSVGVNNAPMELQGLTTAGQGLTGTISRADLPFTQLRALITSGQGLTSSNATSALTLPKLLVSGSSPNFGNLNLKPVAIIANGQTGQDGTAVLFAKKLTIEATGISDNVASGNIQLRAFTVNAEILNGTDAQANKRIPKLTLVAQGLTGTVNKPQEIILPVIEIDASGVAQSVGTASISLPAIQLAASVIESVLDAYSVDSTCYVMNTSTNAMTEYTNFSFNSFANYKGKVIGANDGGIFELLGNDDAGSDIAIEATTANMDFGSEQLKRLLEIYVGYQSDNDLNIQVTLDGEDSYDYTLETQGNTGIHNNRVKLGKGMKGRYMQFKISGTGVNMQLDNITADPIELSRKVS